MSESPNFEAKLRAVRAAVKYKFPTGDIGQMLREIEQGYLGARAAEKDEQGPKGLQRRTKNSTCGSLSLRSLQSFMSLLLADLPHRVTSPH